MEVLVNLNPAWLWNALDQPNLILQNYLGCVDAGRARDSHAAAKHGMNGKAEMLRDKLLGQQGCNRLARRSPLLAVLRQRVEGKLRPALLPQWRFSIKEPWFRFTIVLRFSSS